MDELGIEVTEMLPETGGTDLATSDAMDKYGNVVGSAVGAAGVLLVYELGKRVVIPTAKKGFSWVKDKVTGLKKAKEEEPEDEDNESDEKDSKKED